MEGDCKLLCTVVNCDFYVLQVPHVAKLKG